jgi:ABC-type transport system substrate-binding protein
MNRMAQSAFVYLALGGLMLLAVINTVQLHNLESMVAELRSKGVSVSNTSTTSVSQVKNPDTCMDSGQETEDLARPDNLLKPRRHPARWPAHIEKGQTLRRMVGQDPPGLNVLASNNAADLSEIYKYISNRLGERDVDDPSRWNAQLATYISTDDGGKSYTVRIRKGVKWHKPAVDLNDPQYAWLKADHELTSEDLKFTYDIIMNPQVTGRAASLRSTLDHLDRVEILDKYTYKVYFKEVLYTNLELVADMEPMPQWLYRYDESGNRFDDATWGEKINTHWYNQRGIGVGAYRFLSWETGVKISMEANPDYWDGCIPANFDRVELIMIKDQQAWLGYLKTGQIDYVQIQPQQFKAEVQNKEPYLGKDGLKLTYHDELSWFYIGWNQRRPFFKEKLVRKAMTLAFDRQGLVSSVFAGLGTVITGPFSLMNDCYNKSVPAMPYNLAEAKKLLDEAGWKDSNGDGIREKLIDGKSVPFEFSLLIYGSSNEYETLARVYREALLSIGVKMNIEALEWSAQLKKMDEKSFDAYTGAWAPGVDSDLKQIWHSSQADIPESSNYIEFKNPDADRLIDAHRRELDRTKRTAICQDFHALLAEEQPYTFFYQRKRAMLYWDYLNEPIFTIVNPYRDFRFFSFQKPRTSP